MELKYLKNTSSSLAQG